jgi:photosystem II stability/assembly factor-like uncharacterized protein
MSYPIPTIRRTLLPLLLLAFFGALPLGAEVAADVAADLPVEKFSPAPLFGADVRSMARVPGQPEYVLAGTSAGHVYRSKNGGRTWRPAGAAIPFPGEVIAALHFDLADPERLWIGLWTSGGQGRILWSRDLGATWNEVAGEGLVGDQVYSLATLEQDPNTLYAGTRSGVYLSRDAGATWRHLTAELPEIETVSSLLLTPASPPTVLAGTWRRAYRSDDGGETWRGVFDGMFYDTHVMTLAPVPGKADHLWASTCGWVYESRDLGATWRRFQEGFENRRVHSILPLENGKLLAATVGGIHFSTDGGQHWRRRGGQPEVANVLLPHPSLTDHVLAGSEGDGVWMSMNGGLDFARDEGGMINLRLVALTPHGGELFAAVNHAGTASGIYRRTEEGTYVLEHATEASIRGFVEAGTLYAATDRGLLLRAEDGTWTRVKALGEQRVTDLWLDGDGVLMARGGGKVYRQGTAGFEALPESDLEPVSSPGLPTGHPRFHRVAFDRWGSRLLDRKTGTALRLWLPFPQGTLASAAVLDGQLFVGSIGHGLWSAPLPSAEGAPGKSSALAGSTP